MNTNVVFTCIATCCMLSGIALFSQDRSAGTSFRPGPGKPNAFMDDHVTALQEDGRKIYMNDISTKAIINFKKRYNNVDNEIWRMQPDGDFVATCNQNGIMYMVYYNNKGRWLACTKRYKEEQMSFELRDIIKSRYYDFRITNITEVETLANEGKPVFLVTIKYNAETKIIRVSDGETDIWSEMEAAE
ncbi:MAG TPA: hypothetical protein VFV68_06820 [Agriterribacter sp.]|nr:hypothetical protein [Agriterribacter sp.]